MSLTPAGRTLHDRIILVALERERRLVECLSATERETLIDLLGRLHRRLPDVGRPFEIKPEN
jgi:DNA-binding MarR family transcriptional regulator